MGILDDPGRYYAPPQDDWALGDIVVVPTATLWGPGQRAADDYPQPAPPPDGSSSVVYALWQGNERFPGPLLECRLTPAMIVVDDCVLDKEFNAFVEQRLREGLPEVEAEGQARQEPSLDPLVPVAPILPYSILRFANPQSIRQGQSIGYFPVPESDDMDDGYVDFTRTVPVSRALLRGLYASLSEAARLILRWKLAQFYAARNLSVDAEISAAVGKRITGVHTATGPKNILIVDLELNDGESHLQLRQEPRRIEVPPGHQRGRAE